MKSDTLSGSAEPCQRAPIPAPNAAPQRAELTSFSATSRIGQWSTWRLSRFCRDSVEIFMHKIPAIRRIVCHQRDKAARDNRLRAEKTSGFDLATYRFGVVPSKRANEHKRVPRPYRSGLGMINRRRSFGLRDELREPGQHPPRLLHLLGMRQPREPPKPPLGHSACRGPRRQ